MNNFPFPQSKVYKLVTNMVFLVNDTGNPFKVIDINLCNIWNPLSGVTTVFPTGIKTLKQIYNLSLVEKVGVKYTLTNNENGLPTCFGIIFRDVQPSQMLTLEDVRSSLEMGFTSGPQMVSEINGQPIFRSPQYNIECGKIMGNPLQFRSSGKFVQDISVTTPITPDQTVWLGFIGYTPFGTNLTNGVIVQMVLTQHVRLYSLKNTVPSPLIGNQEIQEMKDKIDELNKIIEKLVIEESSSTVDDEEEDNN